eukprot:scaffold1147_cov250-Pinguiococcus_pyrenoidosus.AAC.8
MERTGSRAHISSVAAGQVGTMRLPFLRAMLDRIDARCVPSAESFFPWTAGLAIRTRDASSACCSTPTTAQWAAFGYASDLRPSRLAPSISGLGLEKCPLAVATMRSGLASALTDRGGWRFQAKSYLQNDCPFVEFMLLHRKFPRAVGILEQVRGTHGT